MVIKLKDKPKEKRFAWMPKKLFIQGENRFYLVWLTFYYTLYILREDQSYVNEILITKRYWDAIEHRIK